jgi:hypothetical protein
MSAFCRACGQEFNSVELFDRDRVGVHAYTYLQGLDMDPPREDGRRCLDVDEMRAKGWKLNKRGRWIDPKRAERARALGASRLTASERSKGKKH